MWKCLLPDSSPYHCGEIAVQQRVGESAIAERNGSVISDTIMAGAIPFLAQQPMVVLGTIGRDGSVWASMLFGERGFVAAPTNQRVQIDAGRSFSVPGDPLWGNIATSPEVGMITLELATRRRLRINGRLTRAGDIADFAVRQAYPNCPKYIQRRQFVGVESERRDGAVSRGSALGGREIAMLRQADTLFIATLHDATGLDCSHRGGNPGFIEVQGSDTIRVPDYAGNSMYNTLGNLELDPRAGVVVADFDAGEILQLSGEVKIEWDIPGTDEQTTGTRRFWKMKIVQWIRSVMPAKPRWEYIDPSPFNPEVAHPFEEGAR